jgi:hypothetical protein
MPADSNPELSSLRRQLFFQLVALVVVAGCLTGYLYRHASVEGKQIAKSEKFITAYQLQQTNISNVLNGLIAYGQKHPDFSNVVLKKYGLGIAAGNPGAAAAAK